MTDLQARLDELEELGLNVARHEDNGANPRPDNRSGWLEGETPDVVEAFLDTEEQAVAAGIEVRVWDPATQLRYAKKEKVPPRPDGAPNRWPGEPPAEPAQLSGMPFGH